MTPQIRDDADRLKNDVAHDIRVGGKAKVSLGGMRTFVLKVVAIGPAGATFEDSKGREYRLAWQHILGPAGEDSRVDDAKTSAKPVASENRQPLVKSSQPPAPPPPSLITGDEIYFRDSAGEVQFGIVAAVGKHGALVDVTGEDGKATEHRVEYAHFIGHRKRRERHLRVIDRGEDGSIMEDEQGKRVFLRGNAETLNKALLPAPVPPEPQPWAEKEAQARIAAHLAQAGFEPMADFIRETFGENFVFRNAAQHGDVAELLREIADQQRALLGAIASLTTPGNMKIDVNIPEQPAPVVHVAPDIHVTVPEQPAPVVNVEIPPRQTVTEIERNRDGDIVRAIQKDTML